ILVSSLNGTKKLPGCLIAKRRKIKMKNIAKTDEIMKEVVKGLEINWEIIRKMATEHLKSKKEENEMKKNCVVYVELADYSYHCDDCDICDPWGWFGHTYVRKPDPKDRTRYADRPVTHIM